MVGGGCRNYSWWAQYGRFAIEVVVENWSASDLLRLDAIIAEVDQRDIQLQRR
jgi:hypothetical protein